MALGAGQSPLPVQGIVHSILVIIAKGSHMPAVQLAALVHGSHSPPPPASPPLEPELPLLEPELPLLEPELPLLEPELPLLEPELDPDPPLLEPDASLCEPPSSSLPPPELLPQATIAMAPIA